MPGAPTRPSPIRPLPPLLINQIAAGEVVERPASVVKELVENALDAGARRISVELELGGIELIRVIDDGHGIPPHELPLAVAPHATSKVASAADLERIATLGFRGEALASIASVSRLSILSRTADPDQHAGGLLEAEGDAVRPPRPAAAPVGTAVTVRTLFFNTPARRKFLRTPATEQARCADVLTSLALAHPAVGFRLTCDGRAALDLPEQPAPRQRVLDVLGRDLESQLVEVHADAFDDARGIALWGLAGLPSLARASARAQHVLLNGRPIRDRTVQHAIAEAYRGLIEPGRYPTAVLMLEMDPAAVDVNVHPAKTEVRFRDSSMVHSVVLRAVRDALRAADLTPSLPASPGPSAVPAWARGPGSGLAILPAQSAGDAPPRRDARAPDAARFADAFRRSTDLGAQGRLSVSAIREALADIPPDAPRDAATPAHADTPIVPAPRPAERVLQVHNSYLVTQDEQGVVIIDQHALHERVMFEQLLARLGAGDLESQRLLTPVPLAVPPAQIDLLAALRPLLSRLGMEAEPIGPAGVAVHAFPTFLFEKGVDPAEFIAELLDKAESGAVAPGREESLHEVLDMMACKAAVKAGDRMSEHDMLELLRLRDAVERSSSCPHGRPTSVRLTIPQLDKLFHRT